MERKQLMEQFNKQPRLGSLATSDADGAVNNAVFSAMRMVDENTVMLAIGDNRSYANLRVNPRAAFIFFEPAQNAFDWQGARLYLRVASIAESGPVLEHMTTMVRRAVGDKAADNVKAAVTFKIEEVRPLIDMEK
jgi:hypothetical protein